MRLRIGLVLIATVLCLGWVLWGMDLDAVRLTLSDVAWGWLGVTVLFYTVNSALRALRYGVLLVEDAAPRAVLSTVTVSFLAVNVFPLRLGEFVRPYLLQQKYGVSFAGALAAVVLERLLDLIAVLGLILIVAGLVELPEGGLVVQGVDLLAAGQKAIAGSVLVVMAGIAVVTVVGQPAVDWIARLLGPVLGEALSTRVAGIAERFVEGSRVLVAYPGRAAVAVVCTAGMWGTSLCAVTAGFKAFGIPISWQLAVTNVTSAITAMILLPTPGFFGPFEAGSVVSLEWFGVGNELARTFSVTYHLVIFFHAIGLGLLFLAWEGWSLRTLTEAVPTTDNDPTDGATSA